jgi:hypothetical protein
MDNTTVQATEEFLRSRIRDLETQLSAHSNCDYWKAENGRVQGQIINLIDNAYDMDQDDVNVILEELCDIVDHHPSVEVEFTATIEFSGRINVARNEKDSFDINDILSECYVDINHGDVVIDNYDVSETWCSDF